MDDGDEFPFDMDAAIEDEQEMFEEMYGEEADYLEPDDVEKEMSIAAEGPPTSSGINWGGGSKALYSPPKDTVEYRPKAVTTPINDDIAFESTRPIGNTRIGSLFSFSSPMATTSEPFRHVPAENFLHERPETGDTQLTTVLEDGSRFFLRSRKKKDEDQRNSRPAVGTLLSVSMRQLSLDADALQRRHLTAKNKHLETDSHAPLLANESSLWVDKYSPRQFSQLLSSEKTNRDVLKALKQWDQFVFGKKGPEKIKGDSRPFQKVLLLCGPPGTGKTTIAHVVAEHCGYRAMEMNASDDRSVEALRETIGRAVTSSTLDKDKRPNCLILDEIDGIDGRAPIDALIEIIKAPLRQEKKGSKSEGSKVNSFPLTRPLICICNDLFSPQLRELRKYSQVFVFSSPLEMRLVQRLRNVCFSEGIQVQSGTLSLLCAATGYDIRSSINTLQFASLKSKADKVNGAAGAAVEVGGVLMAMLSSGLKDVDKDLFQVWKEIFWLKEAARAFSKKKKIDYLINDNLSTPNSTSSSSSITATGQSVSIARGSKLEVIDVSRLRKIRESEFGINGKPAKKNEESRTFSGYAGDVVDSVIGFGDNQLIIDGLFENYLGIRYQDPAMSRTSTSVDWLCDADMWQGKYGGDVLSDGYQTAKYVPLVAGAVHLLCATGTRPELSWPKKESNMRFSRQQRESIIYSVIEGAPQHSLSLRQKLIVATEVIPYLFDIISPNIRPAAMQTLSTAEQQQLKNAAAVMSSCGIRYEYKSNVLSSILASKYSVDEEIVEPIDALPNDTQNPATNRTTESFSRIDEESLFHLTPPIFELLNYEPEAELKGRRRLVPPEVKNMFYLETQKAIISSKYGNHEDMDVIEEDSEKTQQDPTQITEVLDIKPTSPIVLPVSAKSQGAFFSKSNLSKKRALEHNNVESTAASRNAAKKQVIRFKFSQGFSAAVKRPVKITEIL